MVELHLVPGGEEVVEIDAEGTETLLPPPTADDAFAATVKRLQLHKRKRGSTPVVDGATAAAAAAAGKGGGDDDAGAGTRGDGGAVVAKKKAAEAPGAAKPARNPFEDVHQELGMACYELRQLHELTRLLCDQSLFRLENLQADEKSSVASLTDLLMGFEMKKVALKDALDILGRGREMLAEARATQRVYLNFVRRIQDRWRMQAIAHGSYSSNLRAQEPLAVDCGFFSAGSRSKTARARQTRNAARLIVNTDATEAEDTLVLEADPTSFRTIRFAVESAETGACLAARDMQAAAIPLGGAGLAPEDLAVNRKLEALQNSEFCSELFQVLSVEAVRTGELSSGGSFASDATGIQNMRPKVAVLENLLDRIAVSLDTKLSLSISLVPATSGAPGGAAPVGERPAFYDDFCRACGVVAKQHLRRVHQGVYDKSLLDALVTRYRQMEAFERISGALDALSDRLTRAAEADGVSILCKLHLTWTHRGEQSFLELWVGPQVLVRCKLSNGVLVLGSISMAGQRTMPYEWEVLQQSGTHVFAAPHMVDKLRHFVLGLLRHEFLYSVKTALHLALGQRSLLIRMDAAAGTLQWTSGLSGKQLQLEAAFDAAGVLRVSLQGRDVTRRSLPALVRQLTMATAQES